VQSPITVVPTGIDVAAFKNGDRNRFRGQEHIPDDAFVIGIVSRIAPEKNIAFLANAVSEHLSRNTKAHFFLVGQGSSVDEVKQVFESKGVGARLHALGTLQGNDLVDAYHALDLFVYSSLSETQGIVLVEALAAGLPIVALDAPGVREVVQDKVTGRLLAEPSIEAFVSAMAEFAEMRESARKGFRHRANSAVEQFSEEVTTSKLLNVYRAALKGSYTLRYKENSSWQEAKRWFGKEWELVSNMAHATGAAMKPG
jgi:glycosyltransferase involved in cell wall biosynthesis